MTPIQPTDKRREVFAMGSEPAATTKTEEQKKPAVDMETVPNGPRPDLALCFARMKGASLAPAPENVAATKTAKGAVTVGEVLSDPGVQLELAKAWQDTLRDVNPDPVPKAGYQPKPPEDGGWVMAAENPGLGPKFVVVRAARSPNGAEINLDPPPKMPGFKPVATFHTHPISGLPGQTLGPSDADVANANARGIPGIVVGMGGALPYGPKAAK